MSCNFFNTPTRPNSEHVLQYLEFGLTLLSLPLRFTYKSFTSKIGRIRQLANYKADCPWMQIENDKYNPYQSNIQKSLKRTAITTRLNRTRPFEGLQRSSSQSSHMPTPPCSAHTVADESQREPATAHARTVKFESTVNED